MTEPTGFPALTSASRNLDLTRARLLAIWFSVFIVIPISDHLRNIPLEPTISNIARRLNFGVDAI
ncbi:MAG TPA: hypothetical protein EYO02_06710, partial [Rhodospirillales bacterium]|nr:hypothetical protein [Rhodospirillales bacterium]